MVLCWVVLIKEGAFTLLIAFMFCALSLCIILWRPLYTLTIWLKENEWFIFLDVHTCTLSCFTFHLKDLKIHNWMFWIITIHVLPFLSLDRKYFHIKIKSFWWHSVDSQDVVFQDISETSAEQSDHLNGNAAPGSRCWADVTSNRSETKTKEHLGSCYDLEQYFNIFFFNNSFLEN